MPQQNDYVTKNQLKSTVDQFSKRFDSVDKKLEWIIEKLDWLIGKWNAHDEEHTLLNNKVSEHSDQLEVINTKLDIQLWRPNDHFVFSIARQRGFLWVRKKMTLAPRSRESGIFCGKKDQIHHLLSQQSRLADGERWKEVMKYDQQKIVNAA